MRFSLALFLRAFLSMLSAAVIPVSARADPMAVGVNVPTPVFWGTDAAFTNAFADFARWGTSARPYDPYAGPLDAAGYPLQSAGTFSLLGGYPDGVYTLSFTGSAGVRVNGMGASVGNVRILNGATYADVTVNHARPGALELYFDHPSNLADVKLMTPGARAGQEFNDDFVKRLSIFSGPIRDMDARVVNLDPRPAPAPMYTTFDDHVTAGVPEDVLARMAALTGRGIYHNVSVSATDAEIRADAEAIKANLPKGKVYVAFSNEAWDGDKSRNLTLDAQAAVNPALTGADKYTRRAQEVAWQTARAVSIFRQVFAEGDSGNGGSNGSSGGSVSTASSFSNEADRVVGAYEGWAFNPWYSQQGLDFLRAKFGPGMGGIGALSVAPYFGDPYTVPQQDAPGATADSIFAALGSELDATLPDIIRQNKALADQYGLKLDAYEAGQSLTGATNASVKIAMQTDARMGQLYGRYLDELQAGGFDSIDLYNLTGLDSQYGSWGLYSPSGDVKYDAVADWIATNSAPALPEPSAGAAALLASVLLRRRRRR